MIETLNDQIVAVQGDSIIVMAPKNRMTREEAMRHAAWLITLAGDDARFTEILQAVRNA